MSEETPKTRKRTPINELSNEERKHPRMDAPAQPRLWDRKATTLHMIRAVAVAGTSSMVGTQGISQIWLRPKNEEATPLDRSTGYVVQHDALGLEIQIEERTTTGVQIPCGLVFVPWSNVAGITGR